MKIGLLSTYDSYGAGCAAARLHVGLRAIGEESFFIVKHRLQNNTDAAVIQSSDVNNKLFENLSEKYFLNNIHEGNTICSIMYPSIGFDFLTCLYSCDIVNLHWISGFISLEAIAKISHMGKPIVWTLHDQNLMTGACHYTHGCDKYKSDCSNCPQLKNNPYNITNAILQVKEKHLPKEVVIVTPSRWLADCARQSRVLKDHRIEVIPNSLDTQIFKPIDKEVARKKLNLPISQKIILFGATSLKENRKGLALLLKVIGQFYCEPELKTMVEQKQIHILTFGEETTHLDSISLPHTSLGYVNNDEDLALAYSAADVLVLPSLEDNLPNILLESMSCGTPVVAFEVGGMPDVIVNGKNGFLVPLGDIQQFANRIKDLLSDTSKEVYCREAALNKFSYKIQAEKYKTLYKDVLINKKLQTNSLQVPPVFPEIASRLFPWVVESSKGVNNEVGNLNSTYSNVDIQLLLLLNKKILIWGTGSTAQAYYERLCTIPGLKDKLVGFVDNNEEKWNSSFYQYKIYSPRQLYEMDNAVVLIGSMYYSDIGHQLEKCGSFVKCNNVIFVKG